MDKLNSELINRISTKKALIWDFDGVFCDLDWYYGEDFDDWWKRLGDIFTEFEKDQKFKSWEDQAFPDEQINYLIKKYGKKAQEKIDGFFLEKEMLILPHSKTNVKLVEMFTKLDNGLENFVWSNNQRATIDKFMDSNKIIDKFKGIVCRGTEGFMSKPDITAFQHIRKLTDTPLSDFMFIGDSVLTDKIVAGKLGMDFFLYR